MECFKIFVEGTRKGHLLRFYEASPGEKERFEFADGQTVHTIDAIDAIAEPLMKNYREVITNLTS